MEQENEFYVNKDTRFGPSDIRMNTSWAEQYIYDVLRMEQKEDVDEKELHLLYVMISKDFDYWVNRVIREDLKFDTYEFFEHLMNDRDIYYQLEKTHIKFDD